MWLGPIPPCRKSKHSHPGTQILSQIPKDGKGNRGQMPHICPGSPPLRLNIVTCIRTAPVLAYPDYSKLITVRNVTSDKGLGAVLSQKQDGKLRVITYASQGLQGLEWYMKNYSSMKLELLTLKWVVAEKFWEYLLRSEFMVYTNNNPFTYLQSKSKLKLSRDKQLGWQALISE